MRLPTERNPSVEKSSHGPEIKADLLFLGSVGKSGLKARCSDWGLTNHKITASRGVCSCPKSWDAPHEMAKTANILGFLVLWQEACIDLLRAV